MNIKEAEKLFLECRFDEAFEGFKELAIIGEPRAFYFIGEYYTWSYGHVKKDKNAAQMYRKAGYEKGDVLSGLNYAYSYRNGSFERSRLLSEFVPKLIELVETGDVFAQNELADCYKNGTVVKKNIDEANRLYELSAQNGYFRSMNKIAAAYYNGENGEKNLKKAIEIFQKLADLGYPPAIYNIGISFNTGNGVVFDKQKAVEFFKRSYELGYGSGAYQLGYMYAEGDGVPKNMYSALDWFVKGAELGDVECQFTLGQIYHLGMGVDVDYEKAIKWYKLAVEQNYGEAYNNLGVIYGNGTGVEQDSYKAKEYFSLAALNGGDSADNCDFYLLLRAKNNSYTLSNDIKSKVRNIPSFKTDMYKLKSISDIKRKYRIKDDETIISYRVIPKLLAKLETGGTIFTDKGVYRCLPSGIMSKDYKCYGIVYDEMIRYFPALGYSEKEQPQLVGSHNALNNLSFWMTPVMGTESNEAIVDVFWDIIDDVTNLDDEKKNIFYKTQEELLIDCNYSFEHDGEFGRKDEKIIRQLIIRRLINPSREEDALFLVFCNCFARNDFSEAYVFIENNSEKVHDESFACRINPVIRERINEIDEPENDMEVMALKLFCEKNTSLLIELLPRIIKYHYRFNEFDKVETFMNQFENDSNYDNLKEIESTCIKEIMPVRFNAWLEKEYSSEDESFFMYALNKPDFYQDAAWGLIKHYCFLGNFDSIDYNIKRISEVNNDIDFIKQLESFADEYTVKYAEEQYNKALGYIESGNTRLAITCLQEAVKYDSENQEYVLCLIQTELNDTDYSLARKDICNVLKNKSKYDEGFLVKLHEMEVECAEGINSEMCAFYDLISNDNDDTLNNNSESLSKVDQLGMNFYHYAILLKKENLVEKAAVKDIGLIKSVSGFDVFSFGAGGTEPDPTFVQLMRLYDEDAKKLYKDYKLKKAGNTAMEIGAGIIGALLDSAIDSAGNMESNLRSMERDRSYSEHREEISAKREKIRGKRDEIKNKRSQVRDYSANKVSSGDELFDDYSDKLIELSYDKYSYYSELLDNTVSADSIESKMLYLIINNPEILEEIFHGNTDDFVLHEENDKFWYLPESLIMEANNITITVVSDDQDEAGLNEDNTIEEDKD